MSNIKVDVRYEAPKTDKFTALMEQYKAAKELAETTERELTPLIEVGGKAKYHAILEQLGVLASQLKEFSIMIGAVNTQSIATKYWNSCNSNVWFKIEYNPQTDTMKYYYEVYQLEHTGFDFLTENLDSEYTQRRLFGPKGFVTRWGNKNESGAHQGEYSLTDGLEDLYEKLEKDLHSHIRLKIHSMNKKTTNLNNTLKGIKGGN